MNAIVPLAHTIPDSARYARTIEASKAVRWDIDKDVIRGRRFGLDRKYLPDGLSLVGELALAAGVPGLLLLGGGVVALGTPRHRAAVLAAALAGSAFVELKGTSERETSVTAHACALFALVAVAAGWLRGVWSEFLARTPTGGDARRFR